MNEHDKLFKEIESVKENAADLIRSVFPKKILKEIDFDSLQLDNNSYIDKQLKEHYTDLVYVCKRKDNQSVTVTLLFEHKSYKPKSEYIQLLRYMTNIWSYQEKNSEKLTLIVPIIFYHGKQRWKIVPFKDLIDGCNENWAQFVPDFRYLLTDVARYDDETIINKLYKREFNRALALIFKYIGNESLLFEKLYDIMFQLKDYLDNEKDVQLIMSFLTYMMSFTNITPEYLTTITRQISEKGENIVMSTAMKLREEGKLEGINEGLTKGKLEGINEGVTKGKVETARAMLKDGFSVASISKYTGLSEKEINS